MLCLPSALLRDAAKWTRTANVHSASEVLVGSPHSDLSASSWCGASALSPWRQPTCCGRKAKIGPAGVLLSCCGSAADYVAPCGADLQTEGPRH
jgi:hypothetical protein